MGSYRDDDRGPDEPILVSIEYPSTDEMSYGELQRRIAAILNLITLTSEPSREADVSLEQVRDDPVSFYSELEQKVQARTTIVRLSYHTPLLITIACMGLAGAGLAAIIRSNLRKPIPGAAALEEAHINEAEAESVITGHMERAGIPVHDSVVQQKVSDAADTLTEISMRLEGPELVDQTVGR